MAWYDGLTTAQLEALRDATYQAILDVMDGKEVEMEGRKWKSEDLDKLQAQLEKIGAAIARKSKSGIRLQRGVPVSDR